MCLLTPTTPHLHHCANIFLLRFHMLPGRPLRAGHGRAAPRGVLRAWRVQHIPLRRQLKLAGPHLVPHEFPHHYIPQAVS